MAPQKLSNSDGELSGFPYDDLWEEFAPPWERLYDHGIDRDLIDRAFKSAKKLKAKEVALTKSQVRNVLGRLDISSASRRRLADRLYYLAGHYYSPRFHKLFGDDPASARRRLGSVAATAAKLQRLTSNLSPSLMRQFNAVRLTIHPKKMRRPFAPWQDLAEELADVERSAEIVAAEFPIQQRGTSPKVLQGRWLRHAAEAIEQAVGRPIETKVSDAAGKNFRFLGEEGLAFEAYCRVVDPGIAIKTLVEAVRAFHRYGISGLPPRTSKSPI